MTALIKFLQQVRDRESDNYLRDMGFQRCGECDEFTDQVDADDEPCCEACLADARRENESELRYLNRDRI